MAETKYESAIQAVAAPVGDVWNVLSNLQNLERVRHLIPQDKVQELEIDPDYIRIKVDGLGQKICIRIVERTELDTIKFGTENSPLQGNFWIQMKAVAPADTRIKLTLKAEIPMMFRVMLDKKIQQGINDAARMLSQFPYTQWANMQ